MFLLSRRTDSRADTRRVRRGQSCTDPTSLNETNLCVRRSVDHVNDDHHGPTERPQRTKTGALQEVVQRHGHQHNAREHIHDRDPHPRRLRAQVVESRGQERDRANQTDPTEARPVNVAAQRQKSESSPIGNVTRKALAIASTSISSCVIAPATGGR